MRRLWLRQTGSLSEPRMRPCSQCGRGNADTAETGSRTSSPRISIDVTFPADGFGICVAYPAGTSARGQRGHGAAVSPSCLTLFAQSRLTPCLLSPARTMAAPSASAPGYGRTIHSVAVASAATMTPADELPARAGPWGTRRSSPLPLPGAARLPALAQHRVAGRDHARRADVHLGLERGRHRQRHVAAADAGDRGGQVAERLLGGDGRDRRSPPELARVLLHDHQPAGA